MTPVKPGAGPGAGKTMGEVTAAGGAVTYAGLWDTHMKPFEQRAAGFSKETLLQAYVVRVFAAGVAWATAEMAEGRLQATLEAALKDLKDTAKTARLATRTKRLRRLGAKMDRLLLLGGDCRGCAWWRTRGHRQTGRRIPGGAGKCTRPEGHCGPRAVVERAAGAGGADG